MELTEKLTRIVGAKHILTGKDCDKYAHDWVSAGERSWRQLEPSWGIWALPESALKMLPGDMAGMRTIELGCGTGYVSGWMMRLGATAVGIDNSAEQLKRHG